ncbi:protein-serine O-palmitoleoyltransferase porcupine [Lucilia cuprina]|uniref:protein-serine O-palmitoleoyltransferase porcupine n=1 Tax=Lucilia cuprina TaxID=7375 RepID=UPI001F06D62B|nr:protein-serine O-palmitoleoyltransferase porcupine [Lucilia cuprina]
MDYYYYDQVGDNELEDNEEYDYDSMILPEEEETFKDVYQGCIKSSTQQVQQYIMVLLGCGFLQRIAWEVVRRSVGNNSRHQYLYHLISMVCGLIGLWFYVGVSNSIYVVLHVLNLCLFLKLAVKLKIKSTGCMLCMYTILCQLLFEYLLKSEQYETIRGPQMVVSMKLISVAFEVQDEKEKYQFLSYLGYLISPASLILGPWVSLKDYKPSFNEKFRFLHFLSRILFNILMAVVFLNLSNCLIPWFKQLLSLGLWWGTYLDAFSVRCSHYFVCYLSQATVMSAQVNAIGSSSLKSSQSIVNPWAIEFPRSLSDVIRNWNIPMHLWLKQNIFNRLLASHYPYFVCIFLTYLVSCLVHGFNYKVHMVLFSLGCFSYFENLLRRCLAQVFDACIESTACKQNCKFSICARRKGEYLTPSSLLVRLVNFLFGLIVVLQLAYLGVLLSSTSTDTLSILQIWSNMNYLGHILATIMFVFYKCI